MAHKHLLCPFDHFAPPQCLTIMFVFPTNDPRAALGGLKEGLRMTCSEIPCLKGSVYQSNEKGHLGVAWSDDDDIPQLEQVVAPDDIPSYSELEKLGMPTKYLVPFALSSEISASQPSGPVLRVSYTILRGGLLLGLYIHHSVFDGSGTADVLNLWAKNARNFENLPTSDLNESTTSKIVEDISNRGVLLRQLLSSDYVRDSDSTIPELYQETFGWIGMAPETGKASASDNEIPPMVTHQFTLRGDKLEEVSKALAKGNASACSPPSSTNTIISALLWNRITHIRSLRLKRAIKRYSENRDTVPDADLASTLTSTFFQVINLRKYVFGNNADFSSQTPYFGNLASLSRAALPFSALTMSDTTSSLSKITSAINSSYRDLSRRDCSLHLALAEKVPDVSAFWHANPAAIFDGKNVFVTSWANFPFYPDFGPNLGRPGYIRLPHVPKMEGVVVVLPRKRLEGGEMDDIEIFVMLRGDDMEGLIEDEVLGGFVRRFE